jgi:serine/threonine protein phosphatase PrpC
MERFGYSTVGPRNRNEDYFLYDTIEDSEVLCVADGVGGNSCGQFASMFSVDRFIQKLKESKIADIKRALEEVHQELITEGNNKPGCKGMATTFTAAIVNNNSVQLIHTGDSRMYLLRGNGLRQATEDHTEVRRLIKEGLLTFEESINYLRKNVLDSALGVDRKLMMTHLHFEAKKGDRLLLSTDGFHGAFSKVELRDLSIAHSDFTSFSKALEVELSSRILTDNATFIAVQI